MTIIQNIIQPVISNIINSVIPTDADDFLPTDFSGLTLWLDAQDATTIIESGGAVSEWSDKSENNNDAIQATGSSQPMTGGVIGGFNALSFDGANHFFDIPFNSNLNPLAFTIFTVCKVVSSGGFRSPITSRESPSPSNGYILYAANNGKWQFWILTGTGSGGPQSGNRSAIVDESVIITMTGTAGAQSLFVNQVVSDTNTSVYVPNSVQVTRIGAGRTEQAIPNFFFPGEIGSVIIYDRVLPGIELQEVHNFLSNKWNIALE